MGILEASERYIKIGAWAHASAGPRNALRQLIRETNRRLATTSKHRIEYVQTRLARKGNKS